MTLFRYNLNTAGTVLFLPLAVFIFSAVIFTATRALAAPVVIDGDIPIERDFKKELVVRGFERPWGVAWLPSGDILVTERPGRLRLVRIQADGTGVIEPKPVSGVPPVFAQGQGGLLDVVIHPDFETNSLVYLSYAHGDINANKTRVARAIYADGVLKNVEVIYETNVEKTGTQHFGSRLCWLPDKTLLISIGDGGNPPTKLDGQYIREHSQNTSNQLGTLLRVNDDGSIPKDNPLLESPGASKDIYSYGHRNVQGLAHDPIRDLIWVSEHGALGGDELNQPRAGLNYGWPTVTFSREYFDGSRISEKTAKPGMEDPKLVWLTAIAPSGLAVYSGDKFPDWKGDLFAGALIKQSVRRVILDKDGRVTGQSELRFGTRVRDVRQGPDGYLYVLTDENNGQLIRLKPAKRGDMAP